MCNHQIFRCDQLFCYLRHRFQNSKKVKYRDYVYLENHHKIFRQYYNEEDEHDETCQKQLFRTEICVGAVKVCPFNVTYLSKDDPLCRLSEWSNYSSCSTNCGVGTKTRDRKYLHPEYEEACEANPDKENTVEDTECYGSDDNCKPDLAVN